MSEKIVLTSEISVEREEIAKVFMSLYELHFTAPKQLIIEFIADWWKEKFIEQAKEKYNLEKQDISIDEAIQKMKEALYGHNI